MQFARLTADNLLSAIMNIVPEEEREKIEAEEKLKTETVTESDSEDEEGECNTDRWNCALPGREADCVNKIKEIIAHLHKTVEDRQAGGYPLIDNIPGNAGYQGWDVVASNFEDQSNRTFKDPSIRKCGQKFAIAFVGWLMLSEHKLDGMGGHWSCGCFGSFWADIALTIPQIKNYVGIRVSFNAKPCPSRPAWFLLDFMEELRDPAPYVQRQTSAMCASYGERKDWGLMLWNHIGSIETEQEKEAKAKKDAEKAEKLAEKARKEAEKAKKDAEKAEKHYKEEMERQARERRFAAKLAEERRAQEEEIRVAREAEFAAKVAAVAEREKAAKEQERLAKLEKARVAEEAANLKKQQKEAERLAKFVNKKK